MTERGRNFAVGLTAMAGLVGLAGLVALFGYVPELLERGYRVTVELPHAGGLYASNRVTLSGIDIGRIESVRLAADPTDGVIVVALIRSDVRIPSDVTPRVSAGLFSGGATLAFDAGDRKAQAAGYYLPTDGSALVAGTVSGLADTLTDALAEPLDSLRRITERFEALSRQWSQVGADLHELLAARTTTDVDEGRAAANLSTVLQRADRDLAELQRTIDGLNAILGDEKLMADVRALASNTAQLTGKLNEGADRLLERYVHIADELAEAAGAATQLIEQARAGDGTVGRLMSDPALYNNLNDAAQRLGTAMREVNVLLEKLRNEGLPVRFE